MVRKLGSLALFIIILGSVFYFFNDGFKNNPMEERLGSSHPEKSILEKKKVPLVRNDIEMEIKKMINEMSLDEKVGQIIFSGIDGKSYTKETETLITKYNVGGIILFANNIGNPEQAIDLLNQIKKTNKQQELPILLGVDQEGGRVERLPAEILKLPSNKVIAAKNDEELSYNIGKILGEQLRGFGFNLNFAPVLDVNSNPNNPVIGDRSFGNDVELVSKLGIQTMKGLKSQQVIPVVKHFPGHGDTSVDSHFELPRVNKSLEELENLELIPFNNAIKAGVDVIMTAHILLPQIDAEFPATLSEKILTNILRNQLEYDGVIITDDMTMQAITDNFDIGQAAVQSIKAGSDIILVCHGYDTVIHVFDSLKKAVISGEITEERLNESIRRIIQLKEKYVLENEIIDTIDIDKINDSIRKVLE